MAVKTERIKKVGLLNGDGEIEEASRLYAVTEANKMVIYIIIPQSSYEVKLWRIVIVVTLVVQREE